VWLEVVDLANFLVEQEGVSSAQFEQVGVDLVLDVACLTTGKSGSGCQRRR
jgi:hypothetical protein